MSHFNLRETYHSDELNLVFSIYCSTIKTHYYLLGPTIPHFFRLKNCMWPLNQWEHHKIFYIYSLFLWEINFIRLFFAVNWSLLTKTGHLTLLPFLQERCVCRKKKKNASRCLTTVYFSFWVSSNFSLCSLCRVAVYDCTLNRLLVENVPLMDYHSLFSTINIIASVIPMSFDS